jgi:hypothetical protein
MAKVFDFGKVRLVTVVTWVEETDAEEEVRVMRRATVAFN